MDSGEIYRKLKAEFGVITALYIMEVLYPEIYGKRQGEKIKIKRDE